jgi:hypothetical protein
MTRSRGIFCFAQGDAPHGTAEVEIPSGGSINKDGLRQAPSVAFYSDVEHEVSVVTSDGYRVTLTYNLHLVTPNSSITPEPVPSDLSAASLKELCEQLKGALSSLLNTRTFLPKRLHWITHMEMCVL